MQKKTRSCDCLSGEIDREVILPGEAAAVTLAVKPSDLVYKQASLSIVTDDGRTHHFQVRTWTYPPVMLDDGRNLPIALGQLTPGSQTTTRHRLAVLSAVETSPPELRFVPDPGQTDVVCTLTDRGVAPYADGRFLRREYELDVTVTAGLVPGLVMRPVEFAPGPDAAERDALQHYRFAPTVTWTVGSPVSVDPPRWMVTRDELASSVEVLRSRFRLRDRESRPLRVALVECSAPCLTVESLGGAGSSEPEFAVTLHRSGLPQGRAFLGTVRLQVEVLTTNPPVSVVETFRVIAPLLVSAAATVDAHAHTKGE